MRDSGVIDTSGQKAIQHIRLSLNRFDYRIDELLPSSCDKWIDVELTRDTFISRDMSYPPRFVPAEPIGTKLRPRTKIIYCEVRC
jgi:hypothetical protein